MTGALISRDAVGEVLRRHNIAMDPDDFLGMLGELVTTTASLSAGEQEFLMRAGAAPSAFAPNSVRQARLRLALLAEQSEVRAVEGLTTREVAALLDSHRANVRRLVAARGLYTSGRAARAEHVFPTWQFVGRRVLPHLQDVLNALPGDMHPLDVASFMTEAREPLGDRSPVDWLAGGGHPDQVVQLAEEESRI